MCDHSISINYFVMTLPDWMFVCTSERQRLFCVRAFFFSCKFYAIYRHESIIDGSVDNKLQFDHIWWQSDKSSERKGSIERLTQQTATKKKLDQWKKYTQSLEFSVSFRLIMVYGRKLCDKDLLWKGARWNANNT